MLPPVNNCRDCRLHLRELATLRQEIEQLKNDLRHLRRRVTLLKKDNRRLRQELDEARRRPHRQGGMQRGHRLRQEAWERNAAKLAERLAGESPAGAGPHMAP
jgi:predicted RNase H-like nuclease (RuvC/YqgF family)